MAKPPEPRTRPTEVPVGEFLTTIAPERRRLEAERIIELVTEATGADPVMWGSSIVGWGEAPLRYANGATLPWPRVGYAPRKAQHTFYLTPGFAGLEDLLARLGPHTLAVGCLYVKRLDAIDEHVLRALVARAFAASVGA